MGRSKLNRVVIAGRDAPLWLAANVIFAALSRQGITVDVVELPTLLRQQDVYATLPAIEALHNLLGIDESTLLKAAQGAFTLGQSFRDATTGGQGAFFHPYGSFGEPIDDQPFFQYWLKARQFGLAVAFEDFSLTAAAAKHGRMMVPDKDSERFARTDYGYHLPALAYAGYLKGLALRRGVRAQATFQLHADLDRETGAIESLRLDGGRKVEGDLFIDATGPQALLIAASLGVGYESWRPQFPCDRILTLGGERFKSLPPFAQILADESGWLGFYPTQGSTGLVKAYNSALFSDDAALSVAAAGAKLADGEAVATPSNPGCRHRVWEKNCIAVGEAACAFDPIHNVELQAVQSALVHLLALFPTDADYRAERTEYNRLIRGGVDGMRDFQAAHYALNRYGAADFWAVARQAPKSALLDHKVATFLARGDVPLYDGETFPVESWQALFLGHGLAPETYSPRIDLTSPDVMKQVFRRTLAAIKQKVDEQTSHDAYLEIFCA